MTHIQPHRPDLQNHDPGVHLWPPQEPYTQWYHRMNTYDESEKKKINYVYLSYTLWNLFKINNYANANLMLSTFDLKK